MKDKFVGVWVKPSKDLRLQVGRWKNHDIVEISKSITKKLNINKKDVVLDVGCGNGLITKEIAKKCKYVYAVDFSKSLINVAKQKNSRKNIKYISSDALKISKIFSNNFFDKAYCYFCLQHFSYKNGEKIIKNLADVTKKNGLIFIGDIPNKKRKYNYIGSNFKNILMHFIDVVLSRIKGRGQDSIGWWWRPEQILSICKKLNIKCNILNQQKDLPHSHYRFDILIRA